ncbi:MAG: ABC transporter permease [Bacteroidales bacterium]
MKLPLFIAKRYLFAKKSHNVINIISIISMIGVSIGTMALVVVLSVYNGFDDLVERMYGHTGADLIISSTKGKTFDSSLDVFKKIKSDSSLISYSEIIEENVFIKYSGEQSVARIKGVDSSFINSTELRDYVKEGKFEIYKGQIPEAIVGFTLARQMQMSPRFVSPIEIYFPKRHSTVSIMNPMGALNKIKVYPSALVGIEKEFDSKYIIVPIDCARELLNYTTEISTVELNLKDKTDIDSYQRRLKKKLGNNFYVKNKFQQHETVFKMMSYERIAVYSILLFIIIIISCNILGSLTMLVIEKHDDIKVLRSMGASDSLIKRIFLFEGWQISLIGMIIGVVLGLLLCFVQIYFGVIDMPGNFVVSAYPVVVKISDLLLILLSVSLIGLFFAYFPAKKAIK